MSDFENIPEELQERAQWLYWNSSNDTPRKPLPSPAANHGASWGDPDEWESFDVASEKAAAISSAGIGYVNAADNDDYARGLYGVVDLDGVTDEEHGSPKDWVPSLKPFIERDAYVEWSPSAKGMHIPIVGIEVPDWWSDQHFTDDEHEGVEVLTNKFTTYTGDMIRGSGEAVVEYGPWFDEWLREVYKAITGDDPLADDSVDATDEPAAGPTAGDTPDEEWLTEGVAKDALDAINPNCSYTVWRDVGMALANYFGESAGKRLFTSWSRGCSKWDNDAEEQAERIVRDASDYNYDAATLVYHATSAGWDASSAAREQLGARSDGGATTDEGTQSAGGTESPDSTASRDEPRLTPNWVLRKAVNDVYHPFDYDDEGGVDGSLRGLHNHEMANYTWELAKETGQDLAFALFKGPVYSYEDGIWRDDDKQYLREISDRALDSQYSSGVVDELEEHVRKDNVKRTQELGAPDATVVCEDGLLHLLSGKIEPVTPEHFALNKIPTEYDPDAECPQWEAFIEDSVPDETQRKKFQEYAGYTLWHHSQDFGKALFLVGPTDSGKGTALKAIQRVIGKENTAAEPLESLIDSRWGKAQLVDNIANIQNEVSPSGLNSVEQFKTLTGGEDEVDAEFKGKDKFKFTVTQKFLFSTNEVPSIQKADEAFYNRLLFVEFPNTVPKSEQDKALQDKLADEAPGILNWMLDGLRRLLEQGQFTGERAINGKKKICDAFGGVIDRFQHYCLIPTGDPDDVVAKSDLHEMARKYAEDIDKEPEWDSQTGFTRKMTNHMQISQGQRRIDGDNPKVFTGVRVKPTSVFEYGMDDDLRALTSDNDDAVNSGLDEFDDGESKQGFDITAEPGDSQPEPEPDEDAETADGYEADGIEGDPLAPHITHYVREHSGVEDVPRSELVEHLEDRGAAEATIDYWINKCLERGDISEPTEDEFRC